MIIICMRASTIFKQKILTTKRKTWMNRWRQVQTPPSQEAAIKCQFPHSCSALLKLCSSIPTLQSTRRSGRAKSQLPLSCSALVKLCSPRKFSESAAAPVSCVNLTTAAPPDSCPWPLLKCVITAGWRGGAAAILLTLPVCWLEFEGFLSFWFLSRKQCWRSSQAPRYTLFKGWSAFGKPENIKTSLGILGILRNHWNFEMH